MGGRGCGQGNLHAPLRASEDGYKATRPSGRQSRPLSASRPVWRAPAAQTTEDAKLARVREACRAEALLFSVSRAS